jgi:hypothetical protein
MRMTLVILCLAAPSWARQLEASDCCDAGADCCDGAGADCCRPIPPPSVVPPLPLPPPEPPTEPPAQVVLVPGVIVNPPPLALPPPKKDESRAFAKLSVGGAYQLMLGDSAGGAPLDLMIGIDGGTWGGGFKVGVVSGRIYGLTFVWMRIGGGFEFRLGPRTHLGFGLQFGMVGVQRADTGAHENWMGSPTFGAHLELDVAFRANRKQGWYAFTRAGADAILVVTHLSPGALLLGAGLGYRL